MFLDKKTTGLWIIDVQKKLFPEITRAHEVLEKICFVIDASRLLQLSILVTEQYPQGLGSTLDEITTRLPKDQQFHKKTTFSGYKDLNVQKKVDSMDVETWILVGIETHICVLQTAKDLINDKKNVVVLNDATSSRSIYDFSTALEELRDMGARISSSETVIYELLRDAAMPEFKQIVHLVKAHAS